MFQEVFTEIAMVMFIAALAGALGVWLRQPLVVVFIAVGILVGPSGLGWVTARDQVDLLAKLGIALLLFLVGLKLDTNIIRSMGKVALATGLGQVLFTSITGYFIALGLGLAPMASLYVAVALTFSSTIIIVKLLSDKGEIDSLHGRIALGFLIVQDIVVVLVMIGLSAFGRGLGAGNFTHEMILVFLKGLALVGLLGLMMRYVIGPVVERLARLPELLILAAIAWAVGLAAVGDALGFSKEIGAFLGGVSLASTRFREMIAARLVALRDFLLLFFFIDLGAHLDMSILGDQTVAAVVLSLFVLIGNPLIVMIIMGLMGYRKRTGFLAGLTVAQISEFSLILGALGVRLGHLPAEAMGLITLVGLITISLSTYMILYSSQLYEWLGPWLGVFERRAANREVSHDSIEPFQPEVILFGLGRYGLEMADALQHRRRKVMAIDFDPDVVRKNEATPYSVCYGHAEDIEFLKSLPLHSARWIVAAFTHRQTSLALIQTLRQLAFQGEIAVTAYNEHDASAYEAAGANLVLRPFKDGARSAADMLN